MRRILVAGNWKMHGSTAMVDTLVQGILDHAEALSGVDLAVFPPAPYLAQVGKLAAGTRLTWGGQTLNPNDHGAFTGVSPGALAATSGSTGMSNVLPPIKSV